MKMNPVNVAWQRMLRKRTCPQLDLLKQGGEAVEQHLLSCEHCQEKLRNAQALEALASVPPKAQPHTDALKTGDVCQLLRSAAPEGIYNQHGWHNPPVVLVTGTNNQGFVRVAQMHDAPELAGEGDFPLTGLFSDSFAESWNTWPALIEDLRWLGDVQPEIAHAVAEAAQRSHPAPPQGSVAFSFRQQELNIGGFFGRRAAERILERLEGGQGKTSLASSKVVRFNEWSRCDKYDLTCKALERAPVPMAAATATQGRLLGRAAPGNALLVQNNDAASCRVCDVTYAVFRAGDTFLVQAEGSLPSEWAEKSVISADAFVPKDGAELDTSVIPQKSGATFLVSIKIPADQWREPYPLLVIVVGD